MDSIEVERTTEMGDDEWKYFRLAVLAQRHSIHPEKDFKYFIIRYFEVRT